MSQYRLWISGYQKNSFNDDYTQFTSDFSVDSYDEAVQTALSFSKHDDTESVKIMEKSEGSYLWNSIACYIDGESFPQFVG